MSAVHFLNYIIVCASCTLCVSAIHVCVCACFNRYKQNITECVSLIRFLAASCIESGSLFDYEGKQYTVIEPDREKELAWLCKLVHGSPGTTTELISVHQSNITG
jgi:hypothetical protein